MISHMLHVYGQIDELLREHDLAHTVAVATAYPQNSNATIVITDEIHVERWARALGGDVERVPVASGTAVETMGYWRDVYVRATITVPASEPTDEPEPDLASVVAAYATGPTPPVAIEDADDAAMLAPHVTGLLSGMSERARAKRETAPVVDSKSSDPVGDLALSTETHGNAYLARASNEEEK